MQSYYPSDFLDKVDSKYLLIDTNLLSRLYKSDVLYAEFMLHIPNTSHLIIHELVEFEFLRDTYVPADFANKRNFLKFDSGSFLNKHTFNHETFSKTIVQAMQLSGMYRCLKSERSPSLVDLCLAVLAEDPKYLILTENKEDFPQSIFDLVTLFCIPDDAHHIHTYYVLDVNESKINKGRLQLNRIK